MILRIRTRGLQVIMRFLDMKIKLVEAILNRG